MQKTDLKKINLPDSSGVYLFKKNNTILYVGKATSLRDRVKSYFAKDLISTRGSRIVDMVTKANKIDFFDANSVLEALMLESKLIKKHKPFYNVKEKDDKSNYSVLLTDEKIPRILLVRERNLEFDPKIAQTKISKTYGPFQNSGEIKEALKIIRKIFPFLDIKNKYEDLSDMEKRKLVLGTQIGIFPDISTDEATKEYKKNIKKIQKIFDGNIKSLKKDLEKEMSAFAKKLEFEKAKDLKRKIFSLDHIKDISMIKGVENNEVSRIEAYDTSHSGGKNAVAVMVVIENGELNKNEYRKFNIKNDNQRDDLKNLEEVLTRRFAHKEWQTPNLVVIDGGNNQYSVAKKVLAEMNISSDVVAVVKDEKHKPKMIFGHVTKRTNNKSLILKANAEAHRFSLSAQTRLSRKKFVI